MNINELQKLDEALHYLNEVLNDTKKTITNDKNIKVLKEYGFTNDGIYNAIVDLNNGVRARGRSEMLIIKDNMIYLDKNKEGLCGNYSVPGGGWNPNENHINSAIREVEEEARIKTKNVVYSGYYLTYYEKPHNWIQEKIPKEYQWRGYYSEVYIGEYKGKYSGYVAKVNRDDIIKTAKFYPIEEVFDDLYIEHQIAIRKYLGKNFDKFVNSLHESYIINEPDILYNKDKFDSGEINLCFITGHSGSGKSTLAHSKESDKVEAYELDDLQCVADHFTMNDLKKYGDLIYSYFNGEGKKFYKTYKELIDNKIPGSEYEDKLYPEFVHYAMKYAKSHKDKKYIVEGVWLYGMDDNKKPWFNLEEFKPYAFYIKGTSMLISKLRAAKRDAKDADNKKQERKAFRNNFLKKNWKWYFIDEKDINRFREYFKRLEKK